MKVQHTAFSAPYIKALDELGSPGQIEAIVSVFSNVDRGGEVVKPGFFSESLMAKLPKGVWMHDWAQPIAKTIEARELMPGDPLLPDNLKTLGGLYVKGQFNLDTQRGKEAYSDLKFGTIDEFSIGYSVDKFTFDQENDVLYLEKGTLYEWSPVLAGMNPDTALLSLKDVRGALAIDDKGASGKTDFPLGPRDTAFDRDQAEKDIRKWAGAEDAPNAKYRQCYFWYDASAADNFTSYKLPFCMFDGDTMKAMPRGIFRAAGAVQGARGGLNIPDGDVAGVKAKIAGYYRRMAKEFDDDTITVPWANDGKGVRLVEHTEVVRDVTEEWLGRVKTIVALRAKEGRTLSSTNRQMLSDMRDSLMAHCDSLGALLDATDPNKAAADAKEIEAELMRFLALESRMAGLHL